MSEKYFQKYLKIRDSIDNSCKKLWGIHSKHMKCRKGCSMCCQSFKVLPVEFNTIQKAIAGKDVQVNKKASEGQCKFLVNNSCSIYENRPVICRTHGYPLVRINEETEAYEVSYCELNFVGYPLEKFKHTNVFFEDTANSKLYMLNKEFIEASGESEYDPVELIALNNLKTTET